MKGGGAGWVVGPVSFFLIHFVLISSRGEVLFLPICGEEE